MTEVNKDNKRITTIPMNRTSPSITTSDTALTSNNTSDTSCISLTFLLTADFAHPFHQPPFNLKKNEYKCKGGHVSPVQKDHPYNVKAFKGRTQML